MPQDPTQPTDRQREYLTFIRDFTARWGIPPSFDEIGRHFGTTPPSVNNMVKMLESRGFLARVPGTPRMLRVLFPLDAAPGSGPRDDASREVELAVQVGVLAVERLVPVLKGGDRDVLYAAIHAVRGAVDVAIVTAGATEEQREQAVEAIRTTATTALGLATDEGPRARRWTWRRRR